MSPNGVFQPEVAEFLLERFNHRLSDLVDLIVLFEIVPLLLAAVTPDRRDVHHPVTELNEGASLDRNVYCAGIEQPVSINKLIFSTMLMGRTFRQVSKHKIDKAIDVLVTEMLFQALDSN